MLRILQSYPQAVTVLLGFVLVTFSFATSQDEPDFYSPGTVDDWTKEYSVGESYNVRSVPAPTRRGASALRMETRYGDTGNGYHTEMELDRDSPDGVAWYGFSTYIPASWVDSEQTVITAQWWTNSGAGPPLSFEIQGDQWLIAQRWSRREGGEVKQAVDKIHKGEWTDWVVEANWSDRDSGYIRIWRNGEVAYERLGQSLFRNTETLRFKIGLYVWPWNHDRPLPERSSPRVIYHDEIRIGDEDSSYETVNPGG